MALEKQSIVFAAASSDHSLLVLHLTEDLTESGTELQAFVVPLVARRKGMLLALPVGLLKSSLLSPSGPIDEDALVGPPRVFEVNMVFEDEFTGASVAAGFKSEVAVIDFSNDILSALRDYDPITDSLEEVLGFHEANPQAIPAAAELLALAMTWAESETVARTHFYSAREEPVHKVAAVPKKATAKRLTTAVLAEQISSLSAQVALLAAAQQSQEREVRRDPMPLPETRSAGHASGLQAIAPSRIVPKMPAVSLGLQTPVVGKTASKALQLLGPPPRTRASPMTSGLGLGPSDEPYDPVKAPPETPDQILSHQAVALNALVSHLVQGGGLSFDYHSGGAASSSTRGTIKREKLQQDLAARHPVSSWPCNSRSSGG